MRLTQFKTGGAAPPGDILIGKAKSAMRMLIPQEFERVRGKIDDNQTAARPQYPRRLGNAGSRPIGVMQHLVNNRRIKRRIRERHLIHVSQPNDAVRQAGLLDVDARHGEHLARLIDAQRVGDPRPEQFEHASGAGADVEQVARRERSDDIGEDLLLRPHRHRASGCGASPRHCRGNTPRPIGALAFDRCQPLQVEGNRLVLLVARIRQIAAQQTDGAARAEPVKYPASLAGAVEEPGVAEKFQMARDTRLALPKDLRQFGNGQLPTSAQHQQAQPRRLGRGTQRAQQLAHRGPGIHLANHA